MRHNDTLLTTCAKLAKQASKFSTFYGNVAYVTY